MNESSCLPRSVVMISPQEMCLLLKSPIIITSLILNLEQYWRAFVMLVSAELRLFVEVREWFTYRVGQKSVYIRWP